MNRFIWNFVVSNLIINLLKSTKCITLVHYFMKLWLNLSTQQIRSSQTLQPDQTRNSFRQPDSTRCSQSRSTLHMVCISLTSPLSSNIRARRSSRITGSSLSLNLDPCQSCSAVLVKVQLQCKTERDECSAPKFSTLVPSNAKAFCISALSHL